MQFRWAGLSVAIFAPHLLAVTIQRREDKRADAIVNYGVDVELVDGLGDGADGSFWVWEDQADASDSEKCGPLFAAILTVPKNVKRRAHLREMWRTAQEEWGMTNAKFAICMPGGAEQAPPALQAEAELENDILFLDCEEGYLNGKLTNKVTIAMKAYLEMYKEYDFFMKIDDDTFISHRRLCDLFKWRREQQKNNANAYFGVFAEGPHEEKWTEHFPDRNESSAWYEPVETFPGDVYPPSAKGGPGYILSRELVSSIIGQNIAQEHQLNNEDKAVGVWVDALIQQGRNIDIVNIPGTDGYDAHNDSTIKRGRYHEYPYALHHHLKGKTISCLHLVDSLHDPQAPIDQCFNADDDDY